MSRSGVFEFVRTKGFSISFSWALTNGFVKKTQKTSKADLELARKYKADYERRYCNE